MDPDKIVPTKEWYKSKTLWVAVLTTIIGVLQYIQGQLDAGTQLTIVGVVMAALRIITKQPIAQ